MSLIHADLHLAMSENTLPSQDQTDLLRQLALERISPQWAGFLDVLSSELQAQLDTAEYRQLLVKLGRGFAVANPLGECAGLRALEEAMNRVWGTRRWGDVTLSDAVSQLQIVHRACPLPAALQIDPDLAGGYLEGVYGEWMRAAGAPAALQVRQLPVSGIPMHMAFELTGA